MAMLENNAIKMSKLRALTEHWCIHVHNTEHWSVAITVIIIQKYMQAFEDFTPWFCYEMEGG